MPRVGAFGNHLSNDFCGHAAPVAKRPGTAGAAMAACDGPFESSQALADTAASHNDFLASQPIEWVNTLPNMHATTPDGTQLSTDAGGPIDQAGFHSLRAQIAGRRGGHAVERPEMLMEHRERLEAGFGPRVSDDAREKLQRAIESAGIEFVPPPRTTYENPMWAVGRALSQRAALQLQDPPDPAHGRDSRIQSRARHA